MKQRGKILIVDSERIIAEDVRRCLESFGYTVLAVVPSGEEAVEKAKSLKPDLVMMEIVLQGKLDGIDAAERIRSHFHIPVVFLTTLTDEKTVDRAKSVEPSGYLLKPYNDTELKNTVEKVLKTIHRE
ncbi:MAG: response regulator [bacterium]